MVPPGLRIHPNGSMSMFLSIGTPPRTQNPTKYIQMGPNGRVTHAPTRVFRPNPHLRERLKILKMDRKPTNIAVLGLRIRPNRSPSNFLSIGTPPRPQNPTKYFKEGPSAGSRTMKGFPPNPIFRNHHARPVALIIRRPLS